MQQSNLLVTYDPAHEGTARKEVTSLLEVVSEDAEFLKSNVEGLFFLKTKKDPKQVTRELADVVQENADSYKYTFYWIPIEKWCKSELDDMVKAMKDINSRMKDEESWKLDIGKRHYEGKTTDIIMKLTENIDRPKVDLKTPQKIVKVEIIGDHAGIALLDRTELLDVRKVKG